MHSESKLGQVLEELKLDVEGMNWWRGLTN